MVHGTWYITDRDRQKRRQTGKEASRQTETGTEASRTAKQQEGRHRGQQNSKTAGRQAQRPAEQQNSRKTGTEASRTAKQQEGRHRGQQLERMTASIPGTKANNQTHKPDKLTKKTIHQKTSKTQKQKNINTSNVTRGTMTNIY
ncbi:hypothetical protein [Thiolapillus sp.]|uniref:hypothetical protein n=1 Tax=Thiolapillus sp. TaxID=2017437 RepID=UPI003AF4B295